MGLGVYGLGCRVKDVGFKVKGPGFIVHGQTISNERIRNSSLLVY